MKNSSGISLVQLRYFVRSAVHLSMTKAASELFVAQSAVSAAIASLEATLGTQLFVRHRSKGVTLTASGEELLRRARVILADVDDAVQHLAGGNAAGPVDVAFFQNLAPFYLPEIAARLERRAPEVFLRLTESDLHSVNESLQSQVVELAVTYDLGLDPQVSKEVLAALPLYAAVAAEHPLAVRPAVTFAELIAYDMVLLDLPVTRDYLLSGFVDRGVAPRITHRFANYETARAMVARSDAFTLLNLRPSADTTYDGHGVRCVPIADPLPPLEVVLATVAGARLSVRAQLLAEICREVFRELDFAAEDRAAELAGQGSTK
jgi:DNA-binding transcriptional LysR family regulator